MSRIYWKVQATSPKPGSNNTEHDAIPESGELRQLT